MTDKLYKYFELPCIWLVRLCFVAYVIALIPYINGDWLDLVGVLLIIIQTYGIMLRFPRHLKERAIERTQNKKGAYEAQRSR